jgi:hypothetical protein
MFNILFNNKNIPYHILPNLWLPNQDWIKTGIEPSARILPAYKK